MLDAFFEPGYVVAQRLDAAAKVLHVGRPREQGLLLSPVFGEILGLSAEEIDALEEKNIISSSVASEALS